MEAQITLLRKLQDFDLQIFEISQSTERQRDALDEMLGTFEKLQEGLDKQNADLEDMRRVLREKETELEENIERYNQSKAKLSAVANTKQYNAIEKELDTYKRMRAQLEEERDSLKEHLDAAESDASERQANLDKLQAQIDEDQKMIDSIEAETNKKITKLQSERTRIAKDIPKTLIRKYDFIQTRRPGTAVVAASNGTCTGCHMKMPPQMYNELHNATRLITCPSCQRILFYQAPAEEADAPA